MKAPLKTALLATALLFASLGLDPSAHARSITAVSPASIVAPAPVRVAKAARWQKRRLQRKRRHTAARRQRKAKERPNHSPRPAPDPAATPKPAPQPNHEPEPAPSPAPAPAPAPSPEPEQTPAPAPDPEPTPEPSPESKPEPEPAPEPPHEAPLLEAGFEQGLAGWNTAGVGEVAPTVATDIVHEGSKSARVALTGSLHRSELILGGNGTSSTSGSVRFHEGDEYWYGFSFYIVSMVYGKPGAHNLIMQFKSADGGSPAFGLMLWDYQGHRGLWSHGTGMGGDRYLAAAAERRWHDVVIHFKASSRGDGFYELYLDGSLVDSRSNASMIVPGAPHAYIKDGIYRNGDTIPGTSEIRLDAARLGTSLASVSG